MKVPITKLSKDRIDELLKQFPGMKLDSCGQHFVIKHYGKDGRWLYTDFVPTWKQIPQGEKLTVEIEICLKKAFETEEQK